MNFYIQSGYDGKEVGALMSSLERSQLCFSAIRERRSNEIPVGTVEFVESFIGAQEPDYYPPFLDKFLRRRVWRSEFLPERVSFVKPADRHKRFDAKILHKGDLSKHVDQEWKNGPYWCSEVIVAKFSEEWRYYVANGEILAAYWYQGQEQEVNPPSLDIDWPQDFCGAVDFGRSNGTIFLIENNLPYACGWYGPYSEGRVYAEWLKKGWVYLNK